MEAQNRPDALLSMSLHQLALFRLEYSKQRWIDDIFNFCHSVALAAKRSKELRLSNSEVVVLFAAFNPLTPLHTKNAPFLVSFHTALVHYY
jgi:hypothetical protein